MGSRSRDFSHKPRRKPALAQHTAFHPRKKKKPSTGWAGTCEGCVGRERTPYHALDSARSSADVKRGVQRIATPPITPWRRRSRTSTAAGNPGCGCATLAWDVQPLRGWEGTGLREAWGHAILAACAPESRKAWRASPDSDEDRGGASQTVRSQAGARERGEGARPSRRRMECDARAWRATLRHGRDGRPTVCAGR
jgi:hypothetical protein